jgi:DNA replication ATP-dependent helicase Dna2
MSIPIEKQIEFFDWQIHEIEQNWLNYLNAKVLDLYQRNKLYLGKIWGYDKKRGHLIVRFNAGKFPRLNEPLTVSYPKASAGRLSDWPFSYAEYRSSYSEKHSGAAPIFFLDNQENPNYRFLGFKNISLDFLNHIQSDLDNNTKGVLVFGEEDPPIEYLKALQSFTRLYPNNSILNSTRTHATDFQLKNFTTHTSPLQQCIELINKQSSTIIQGPPGTGKTHLIAELCNHFSKKNYRICVTALTNKALSEAIEKPGIFNLLKEQRVFKTNISSDEKSKFQDLQNHDIKNPIAKGHILLTTYYSLSKILQENFNSKAFDLIIIEEASQAFLTTIAGFTGLANKALTIGDFKQMKPIVLNESGALSIHDEVPYLINGLLTYTYNNKNSAYRLIESYRLTAKAAELTGIFYDNSLISKSSVDRVVLQGLAGKQFCKEGGTTFCNFTKMDEGKVPNNAITFLTDIIKSIKNQNDNFVVAVLAPYKDTVTAIIDNILKNGLSFKNLDINTIDRIQGLTVDYCIILIPSYRTKFAYQVNRFNVATSRAKRGTLIIAEEQLSDKILFDTEVQKYLSLCKKTTNEYCDL